MSIPVNCTNVFVIFGINVIMLFFIASVKNPLNQAIPQTMSKKQKHTIEIQDKGYIKRLPKAIVIGAKKSGTSALRTFLREHPDIQMAWNETHFFCNYSKFCKGMEYYKSLMLESYPHQITMEKTPRYFVNASVPYLVYKYLGKDMKFILLLRDPVERIHSDYNVSVDSNADLVQISSYDDNLKRWLEYYPLDKFLILENKDLASNPVRILQQIEDFLGVKRYFTKKTISFVEKVTWNKKHVYNHMSSQTRRILTDYFRPHSLNFFKIVNRTFNWQLYHH